MGSLRLNDARDARRALSAAPEKHRGWEWRYAHQRLDGSSRTMDGGARGSRAWSATGRPRVAVTAGETVHSGGRHRPARRLGHRPRAVNHFTLDDAARRWPAPPTTSRPACASGTWSPPGAADAARPTPHPVLSVRFAPGGRRVAASDSRGALRIWEAATGRELLSIPAEEAQADAITFDQSGDRFVCASRFDGKVHVRDSRTGRLLHLLDDSGGKAVLGRLQPGGRPRPGLATAPASTTAASGAWRPPARLRPRRP
jgi:hypothetical protein